jgi:hypothetical protein
VTVPWKPEQLLEPKSHWQGRDKRNMPESFLQEEEKRNMPESIAVGIDIAKHSFEAALGVGAPA